MRPMIGTHEQKYNWIFSAVTDGLRNYRKGYMSFAAALMGINSHRALAAGSEIKTSND